MLEPFSIRYTKGALKLIHKKHYDFWMIIPSFIRSELIINKHFFNFRKHVAWKTCSLLFTLLHILSQDKYRNLTFIADTDHFLLFLEHFPFNILLSQYCHIGFRCNDSVLGTQKIKSSSLPSSPSHICSKNLKISDVCI